MPSPRAVESLSDALLDEEASESDFVEVAAAAEAEAAGAPSPSSLSFAVSLRTGAGFSGSLPPAAASSIHRTTLPSEYVWSVLNANWSVSSGS